MERESIFYSHTPVMTIILHLIPGLLIAGIGGIAAYLLRNTGVSGIIGHCLLNLVGDTIGLIPLIFV
jgi:hypothetical protein